MQTLVQQLKESALFSQLSDEIIEREILPYGRLAEIPKGNHLVRSQERLDFFGIVLKGKINILHIYANGNYGIMGILEPSDLFGADLVCTRSRISPYYAVAAHQTRLLTFPASLIMESGTLCEELRLHLLQTMLTHIADENMRKEYRLAILFQKGLRDRILTFLTMQARKRHQDTFTVPFTREEMASYLCVNRSCLSHELSRMEQEGILTFCRNTFTLHSFDGEDYDL